MTKPMDPTEIKYQWLHDWLIAGAYVWLFVFSLGLFKVVMNIVKPLMTNNRLYVSLDDVIVLL